MDQPVCKINTCERPQGLGTWMNIRTNTKPIVVPVCEEHWQVIRTVR